MLDALARTPALTAGELARFAGILPQTASTHLAKLVEGGLLMLTAQGRHRYYRLASGEVAHALEALAVIAPPAKVRSLRASLIAEQLRIARTCYDHLAGKLGVQLTQALVEAEVLRLQEQERRYQVTDKGEQFLARFGLDLEKLQQQRRAFATPCLDWSERRSHLGGALGAALMERLFQLGWVESLAVSRVVRLTKSGQKGLSRASGGYVCLDGFVTTG